LIFRSCSKFYLAGSEAAGFLTGTNVPAVWIRKPLRGIKGFAASRASRHQGLRGIKGFAAKTARPNVPQ
jgi:hypothetical protein